MRERYSYKYCTYFVERVELQVFAAVKLQYDICADETRFRPRKMTSRLQQHAALSVELPEEQELEGDGQDSSDPGLLRCASAPPIHQQLPRAGLWAAQGPRSCCSSRAYGSSSAAWGVPSLVRVTSATVVVEENPQPRTPVQKVIQILPKVSFERLELPPSTPLVSPLSLLSPRRRLSVTYVRRSSKFVATRTEVSIECGPLQILLLIIFLASCSAYGVNVPGFGFFVARAPVSRSAVASSGSATSPTLDYAHTSSHAASFSRAAAEGFSAATARRRRRLLETLQCAATTTSTSAAAQSFWTPPMAWRPGPSSLSTRSASASASSSASWGVRTSLLNGMLRAEHRLRAVLSGSSGMLAACACLTAFLGEAACSVLFPDQFGRLRIAYGGTQRAWSEATLAAAEAKLHAALAETAGPVTVTSRVKSLRSVFEKLVLRGSEAVDDFLAMRVILEPQPLSGDARVEAEAGAEVKAGVEVGAEARADADGAHRLQPWERAAAEAVCIRRLRDVEALVHTLWPGAVAATKDYVSQPKQNGYRSVHVLLRLPGTGERLEVQIRTRCMHEHAERGGASHAHYKAKSLGAGAGRSTADGLGVSLSDDAFHVSRSSWDDPALLAGLLQQSV